MFCSHCQINNSSGYLHFTVYLAVMLQASWHTAELTKSQEVHISSHDELQKLHNINFAWHRSRDFLSDRVEKQEFLPAPVTFFSNNQ